MRVLWISHSSGLDGAERCLIEAVRGLNAKGVINDVVVPQKGLLIAELAGIARNTIIQPHPHWIDDNGNTSAARRVMSHIRHSRSLSKIARSLDSDVIISNSLVIACGAIAAKLAGVPHVWYIHEFLEEDHNMKFALGRKFSLQIVDKLSRRVITTSQTVLERFKGEISAAKLQTVYCASEALNQTTENSAENVIQDKSSFHIVLIGRKSPSKGQKDAVEALSLLIKKKLKVCLWLVGKNTDGYEDELKSLARDLGIQNNVNFIAHTRNPAAYVAAADVVLMTSRNEAFGRVTAEAMKLGKAIIASDGGANKELITENWNGLLYQTGVPASLAEKIEILYHDNALRETIGVNAKEWSLSKFNLENYASTLIDVFEQARNK